ncbi:Uncharacterised protein [Shigella sonnei]|nr:Uncharacterised protein [Shigella sonnei]CSG05967.1 Uncharacterised protein [Shigella sonnei]CSG11085.1 Uncharacterised protein [Shigella sonnei]CSG46783.1 Uncharacterised protein [Shigella sonnei]CSH34480.1 Uncharacterised protein [Shigella sonnei]
MFTFYKPFFVSIEIVCQTLALCSVQISQQLCCHDRKMVMRK